MSDLAAPRRAALAPLLTRSALPLALGLVALGFALAAPAFLTGANLLSLLVNNFALLAVVSLAMTLVVTVGGIDLSVGTAIDVASLALVSLVLAGEPLPLAIAAALGAGAAVGAFNAVLVAGLGVSPFLATLGTLFIGRSLQQLLTNGGNPVYLPQSGIPAAFAAIGRGSLAGVPVPLLVVAALAAALMLLLRSRFGREATAVGVKASVALYSGIRTRRVVALAYVVAGLLAAFAGIVLSATVNVYVLGSGNAFLLNSIGATFIGTTLSPRGRPNVPGTLLGVLVLAVISNGLLLTGISFHWQQVATGLVILAVLALGGRRAAA